jgi:hypothetical protein
MTAADLHRFLVVCALVSDLYCPGYNPKQALAKDSNLARTAVRYKVDTAKITAAVRPELSSTKTAQRTIKRKSDSTSLQSSTPTNQKQRK